MSPVGDFSRPVLDGDNVGAGSEARPFLAGAEMEVAGATGQHFDRVRVETAQDRMLGQKFRDTLCFHGLLPLGQGPRLGN